MQLGQIRVVWCCRLLIVDWVVCWNWIDLNCFVRFWWLIFVGLFVSVSHKLTLHKSSWRKHVYFYWLCDAFWCVCVCVCLVVCIVFVKLLCVLFYIYFFYFKREGSREIKNVEILSLVNIQVACQKCFCCQLFLDCLSVVSVLVWVLSVPDSCESVCVCVDVM